MDRLARDIRIAVRSLGRTKAFTLTVLITLGLGIGANASIFSVVNGVLLEPLPFGNPDRIVHLEHADDYSSVSEPEFMDYRRDIKSLDALAAYAEGEANLTGGTAPERVNWVRVSDRFFDVMGVTPIRGRLFRSEEEGPGTAPAGVVIISHGLWQRHYGADPNVIGRTIDLNETARTVIGVLPPRFDFPSPKSAVYFPLRLNPDSLWTRNNHYLRMVGRLRPGSTLDGARAEADVLTGRWVRDFPETYFPDKLLKASIIPIRDRISGSAKPYLLALLGATALVLLIACVNVANLLLVRGEGRRSELAIRTALGASGNQLARQLFLESGIIAAMGGVLGLAVAWVSTALLLRLAPSTLPRIQEIRVDVGVLGFTLLVSTLTGILFGLLPAFRAARSDSMDALRKAGRRGDGQIGKRARVSLVIAEVALAVTLLAGAGLLIRSLRSLQSIDPGFEPSNILTARLNLPARSYTDAQVLNFIDGVDQRLRAIRGIERVAVMGWAPVIGGGGDWSIVIDGLSATRVSEAPVAAPQQVSADYFQLMGIPILQGRSFTRNDRSDAAPVVIVNATLAKQLWPDQDPVGHRLRMFSEGSEWATVIGVVGDIRSSGVEASVPGTMYFPYDQAPRTAYFMPRSMTLAVKTAFDPTEATTVVRRAVQAQDAAVPISEIQTMDAALGSSFSSRRFTTMLLGSFAALALALAGVGIYGVVAYGVSQRTFEIGLRIALGAERWSLLKLLVISEGGRMIAAGLAIGLAGAIVAGRVVRSLLVGVSAVDPVTIGIVLLALTGVGVLASVLPARRAMRVSPTQALRGE